MSDIISLTCSKIKAPIFCGSFLVAYFCYSPPVRLHSDESSDASDTDLEVDDNVVKPPKPPESLLEGQNLVYNAIHPVTSNSGRKSSCTSGPVSAVHKISSPSAPKYVVLSSYDCVDTEVISKTAGTGNPKLYYILKVYLMPYVMIYSCST